MICCDLIGPDQKSERNHHYILTIIDVCTRYLEAIQLKSITTEEVAKTMFNVYCRLGIPERIHTDRGGQFTSEMMEEINKMLMMKHTMYSPWHAEGNSIVEMVNETINTRRTRGPRASIDANFTTGRFHEKCLAINIRKSKYFFSPSTGKAPYMSFRVNG